MLNMWNIAVAFCAISFPTLSTCSRISVPPTKRQATSNFWYANLDHVSSNVRGFAPNLDGDFTYPIHKAISPGDGASIQAAINAGTNGANRHGQWIASQPRVVYIPSGEYIIRKTILMNTDTVLIGDATNPPILKAAPGFTGDILINGQDPTTGISGELSFAVALKHIILDTRNVPGATNFTALYWGVAQASHLQNVKIVMPRSKAGNGHTGIKLGRGSTLGVSDVRIESGQNGIWHNGHQQAAYKSIYFYQNTVGMLIDAGSTISIVDATFDTVGVAVLNSGGFPWIGLVDSRSINSGITLKTTTWPNYLVENLDKDTFHTNVIEGPGDFVLPATAHVDQFSWANTVGRNPVYGQVQSNTPRPAALARGPGGKYLYLPAPSYASNPASDFINVKDPAQNGGRTVLGDNTRDESSTLNAILSLAASQNKIVYFPFGKYRVDSTLHIPPGTRIVGQGWATIVGFGSFFKDSSNPKPVVRVGNPGDVGTAQISDIRITVGDVLPGAILLQFNMKGATPGAVAIWTSLVTVGGTRGAEPLTNACRSASAQCKAAFLGIHFAAGSSVYLENVWNWVADHIAEDIDGGSNIAAGRGVLIESKEGTWLHALGSEHWWLYQLNLRQAENVFVSMLQAETNYDQGDNNPMDVPLPWTLEVAKWGDPDYERLCDRGDKRCRMGMSNYFNGGRGIRSYSSAAWAFFSGPNYRSCAAGSYTCQKNMHVVGDTTPADLQVWGLCSKDAEFVLKFQNGGREVRASPNFTGSWPGGGGVVGRWTEN
ncbi:glycoside hydrolase family 55 protein [Cercophora samala]|uniref:Glycoside hydrolase family 55 protein n=1 Tax=Cercophora samala TaxID=330535 RepID=A0AA39ZIL0_9PEZI|nr:glycoside hydrolase family 55 protein [Cercophora samala]